MYNYSKVRKLLTSFSIKEQSIAGSSCAHDADVLPWWIFLIHQTYKVHLQYSFIGRRLIWPQRLRLSSPECCTQTAISVTHTLINNQWHSHKLQMFQGLCRTNVKSVRSRLRFKTHLYRDSRSQDKDRDSRVQKPRLSISQAEAEKKTKDAAVKRNAAARESSHVSHCCA